ncbi:MAG: hypothetical protein PUF72_05525 [Clostridiales bacterium]|nr:hypothetical protein [Clostridiales bacterium]
MELGRLEEQFIVSTLSEIRRLIQSAEKKIDKLMRYRINLIRPEDIESISYDVASAQRLILDFNFSGKNAYAYSDTTGYTKDKGGIGLTIEDNTVYIYLPYLPKGHSAAAVKNEYNLSLKLQRTLNKNRETLRMMDMRQKTITYAVVHSSKIPLTLIPDNDNYLIHKIQNAVVDALATTDCGCETFIKIESYISDDVPSGCYVVVNTDMDKSTLKSIKKCVKKIR